MTPHSVRVLLQAHKDYKTYSMWALTKLTKLFTSHEMKQQYQSREFPGKQYSVCIVFGKRDSQQLCPCALFPIAVSSVKSLCDYLFHTQITLSTIQMADYYIYEMQHWVEMG